MYTDEYLCTHNFRSLSLIHICTNCGFSIHTYCDLNVPAGKSSNRTVWKYGRWSKIQWERYVLRDRKSFAPNPARSPTGARNPLFDSFDACRVYGRTVRFMFSFSFLGVSVRTTDASEHRKELRSCLIRRRSRRRRRGRCLPPSPSSSSYLPSWRSSRSSLATSPPTSRAPRSATSSWLRPRASLTPSTSACSSWSSVASSAS